MQSCKYRPMDDDDDDNGETVIEPFLQCVFSFNSVLLY